jgi:hypothetical protein
MDSSHLTGPTTAKERAFTMGSIRYLRSDVFALADRLEARAKLVDRIDTGQRATDMIAAARLLRILLEATTPASSIAYWNVDVDHGGR